MVKRLVVLVSLLLLVVVNLALAKVGVLSTDQVAKMVGRKNVVIVDVRSQEAYLKSHLLNAVNLTHDGGLFIKKFDVRAASIAPNTQLQEVLSNIGIKPTDTVIVYSGGDNPTFFLINATRVILALRWAGIRDVYFMNGGFEKWVDEKRPTQSGNFKLVKSNFVIEHNTPQTYCFSDFVEWAVNNESKIQLVDARPVQQYTGEYTQDKRVARYGHIEGALSLPVGNYVKKEGNYYVLKNAKELEVVLKKANVDLNKPIISYCNTAYFGSGLWFIANAVLNDHLVCAYNGSMVSASRDPNIKIVKGSSPL